MKHDTVPQVVVIGSINTDMVVATDQLPRPGETVLGNDFLMTGGGKGANQAVAAARLGASVSMVASLGQDLFADAATASLLAETIDCQYVYRNSSKPSGVALISVDNKGENQIVVAPGANNSLSEHDVETALASLPDHALVLIQLEIPMATVTHAVKLAARKKCRIILDPAPAQALHDSMMKELYLITPNLSEAELLTGIAVNDVDSALAASRSLLQRGPENVALTMGAEGVLLANQSHHELIPAPSVQAVDTTAAGDCFNGAVAFALSTGSDLSDAMSFGCKAAAIAVTRRGAQSAMPRGNEINS